LELELNLEPEQVQATELFLEEAEEQVEIIKGSWEAIFRVTDEV